MNKIFYLIFLLVLSRYSLSQEVKNIRSAPLVSEESIQVKLLELSQLPPEKYFDAIDNYRSDIEKFVEYKKRVCRGEFSTIVLNQRELTPNPSKVVNKLSSEERKICFRELKLIQISFINNMFKARKRYLNFLHKLRLEELAAAHKESIDDLKASFDKKISKRKKR